MMNDINGASMRSEFSVFVGQEIARLRRSAGLTGAQLANFVGISQQQLSRYERGLNEINVPLLIMLLKYLESSLEGFFYEVAHNLAIEKPSHYENIRTLFKRSGELTSLAVTQEGYKKFN